MKKLALVLSMSLVAGAAFVPARSASGAFPGPNGSIAYTADLATGSTLCSIGSEGGTPHRLTDPDQGARQASWSPGGDDILFTNGSTIMQMPAMGMGAGTVEVTAGQQPTWSPDETRIAFVRDGAIYTADIDGTKEQLLVDSGANPAWSPDSSLIAFDDELRDEIYDNGGIYLVPADGGTVRHLSGGFEPSWSPDGTEIAARNSFFGGAIIAIDVATGHSRTVTSADYQYHHSSPAWSPDGAHIAFSRFSFETPGDREIWVVDADGQNLRQATDSSEAATDADWQPVVDPVTPSTGQPVECVSYPYDRSVSLRLSGHLLAEGRVRSLGTRPCHRFVPVQIRKKKPSGGERVFYVRSRRGGRFKLRLPDKAGKYYAIIAPDDREECAADRSRTKSHRH